MLKYFELDIDFKNIIFENIMNSNYMEKDISISPEEIKTRKDPVFSLKNLKEESQINLIINNNITTTLKQKYFYFLVIGCGIYFFGLVFSRA